MRNRLAIILILLFFAPFGARGESVGLVLSGGGAKGLSHVGVIKALEENDIPIDYICGTSIGAIVGGLYAIGYSPDEMMALFKSAEFESWYKGLPEPDFATYFALCARELEHEGKRVHFELGRSIVGQCGELISRVLYNKTTPSGRHVAIIDASMTELLRPALYGARHRIINLTPHADGQQIPYMVAGTVCESSDIFARDAVLPELRRGDLVAIESAGAYGMSMASCYNLHNLPTAVYSDEIQ